MARGISELDVHHAADDIVALGERPTVERIRAHLGTGSPNTVTRWLETWWQTLGGRLRQRATEAAQPSVPEQVASLSQRLWQAALQEADRHAQTQLLADRHALEDRELALANGQAAMTREAEAAHELQREAEARAVATAATAELLATQVSQLTTQVQDLLRQRDGAYARAERLEQELEAARRGLEEASAIHEQDRKALEAHVRAAEDRSHAEVDRLRIALKAAEKGWALERTELARDMQLLEQRTRDAGDRERAAQGRAESEFARATALAAQVSTLRETTERIAEAIQAHQSSAKSPPDGSRSRPKGKRKTAIKSPASPPASRE